MITVKKNNVRITILLVLCSFIAAHLLFWFLPNLFLTWDAKCADRLFLFRSSSRHFKPLYDDTVVHVDLTDRTIQKLDDYYLNRSHHAHVIRNLAEMGVSLLMYDFIFVAQTTEKEDKALMDATAKAGNVLFGLAFRLTHEARGDLQQPLDSERKKYLDLTRWSISNDGNVRHLYRGTRPLTTFPRLALTAKGSGYLSLKFDRDGVYRRLPLLIRYNGAYYPSFALRAVCEYLSVHQKQIHIRPGKAVILKDAVKPGSRNPHDISIPIDRQGNMLVNFIGP